MRRDTVPNRRAFAYDRSKATVVLNNKNARNEALFFMHLPRPNDGIFDQLELRERILTARGIPYHETARASGRKTGTKGERQ